MKITVQITVRSEEAESEVAREVGCLERGPLRAETLGLSLADARAILSSLEQTLVEQQSVRQRAERLEAERAQGQHVIEHCLQAQDALSEAAVPRVIGLDGVYVHAKDQPSRTEGWFEVIMGKRLAIEGQAAKCFAFVSRCDAEPKGRLFDWLNIQGLQSNQAITFLSDGGDTVRELPRGFTPQAEYLLDWFHMSMRRTTMGRLAKGVRAEDYPDLSADLEEMLEHLKWNLWHGKVPRALEIADELAYALDVKDASPEHRKLLKAAGHT